MNSAPVRRLRETLLFSVRSPWRNTTCTEILPSGRWSAVSSPSELYISTSLTEYDRMATTFSARLSRARMPASMRFRNATNGAASASSQGKTSE